ncbi:MAG: hypothetical protein K2I44_03135, partial [Muribaculaceae bacterium]|nr:hypothetical protein [Muribaculaceae bacterium]
IKLQNIADGSVKVIAEPMKKKSTTQKEEGFISFLWNSLTGQKKCSTRIVDNELFNVLTNDLSQTFYVLREKNPSESTVVCIASSLPEYSFIRFSYVHEGERHEFDVPIKDGRITIEPNHFSNLKDDDAPVILRLTADWIKSSTEVCNITNSMNIFLINE